MLKLGQNKILMRLDVDKLMYLHSVLIAAGIGKFPSYNEMFHKSYTMQKSELSGI